MKLGFWMKLHPHYDFDFNPKVKLEPINVGFKKWKGKENEVKYFRRFSGFLLYGFGIPVVFWFVFGGFLFQT